MLTDLPFSDAATETFIIRAPGSETMTVVVGA
jgi:hypothetical protein